MNPAAGGTGAKGGLGFVLCKMGRGDGKVLGGFPPMSGRPGPSVNRNPDVCMEAWLPGSGPGSAPAEAGQQGGTRLRVHKFGEKTQPWRHLHGLAVGNSLGRRWASWASRETRPWMEGETEAQRATSPMSLGHLPMGSSRPMPGHHGPGFPEMGTCCCSVILGITAFHRAPRAPAYARGRLLRDCTCSRPLRPRAGETLWPLWAFQGQKQTSKAGTHSPYWAAKGHLLLMARREWTGVSHGLA